jgi:hypothetical protein
MIPPHFLVYIGGSLGVIVVLVIVIEALRLIPTGPLGWIRRR